MKKNYSPRKVEKKKEGRRIAIGDVHGCYYTLKRLLEDKVGVTKEDQIFLLGDIIDKGENSSLVLDLILELKRMDFQIFPIKGNHEEKLLTAYNCGFEFFENYLEEYNSLDLLGGDLVSYLDLISTFDYCIELDEFVLSHCGINENRINPFSDLRGMFPLINFQFDEKELRSKIQVHGHVVRTIEEIKNSINQNEKRFSIDSGCCVREEEYGYLTALDLDSMILYHEIRNEAIKELT